MASLSNLPRPFHVARTPQSCYIQWNVDPQCSSGNSIHCAFFTCKVASCPVLIFMSTPCLFCPFSHTMSDYPCNTNLCRLFYIAHTAFYFYAPHTRTSRPPTAHTDFPSGPNTRSVTSPSELHNSSLVLSGAKSLIPPAPPIPSHLAE